MKFKIISYLLFIYSFTFVFLPLSGQEVSPKDSTILSFQLDQISVTALRDEMDTFNTPNEVTVIQQNDFLDQNVRLLPDVFQRYSSVYMQKTNYGGGSPIIRGFMGNQVLILIDGIRLNNSTYRYGPNQYLNTIDPGLIKSVEVMHGPGSVLYGSDALGGVINIITKKPDNFVHNINSYTRTSTADESIYQNLNYSNQFGDISFLVGGTYKKFNNLNAGGNVEEQEFTNFDGIDLNGAMSYNFKDNGKLSLNYNFTRQNEVPRTDRLTAGNDIKYLFNPQVRQLGYLSYTNQNISSLITDLSANLSYNYQKESREIISSKTPNLESNDKDEVNTIGGQITLISKYDENIFSYGVEFYRDKINSERFIIDADANTKIKEQPTFTDNSSYQTFGAFLQHRIKLGRFALTSGVRYSKFQFEGNIGDPFGLVSSDKGEFTFAASVMYALITNKLNLVLAYSQGFRAPNVDDITSFGKSGSGDAARYDTPNPNLDPEKSHNIEIGVKFRESQIEAGLSIYYSKITDLLEPRPTTFNGADSLFGFQTYSRQNVGEAELSGFDSFFQWYFSNHLIFTGNISYTYGQNLSANEPLSRVPPLNGYFSVTWNYEILSIKYYMLFASAQKRISQRDIRDYRIGIDGTSGYMTQNISLMADINEYLDLFLNFENVFDELYKTHGSGLYSPGRSLTLGLALRY